MAQFGYFALVLAFGCAAYTVIVSIIGLKTQTGSWIASAKNALQAIAGLLTVAVLLLLYFLIRRDFQIEYVASYTDLTLPIVYVISALWAGQQGSLLFWGWVLSLCSTVFIWRYKPLHTKRTAFAERSYIYITFAVILGFFLVLLIVAENPFKQLSVPPLDGNGLNPLLQNPYMAIHPPVLFIGYAGFVVPFALAFAALGTGKIGTVWLKSIRGWTLFAWYFLGMGIILGAHWAYLELGWGGYWAWDPVENASFIPWITSTALIHTLILQRRKGMLKIWNILLSIITFTLCIFGTFITRSGMIASVHAFNQSTIGYYFLAFLMIAFFSAGGLIAYRWKTLQSHNEVQSLLSKESSFFLANLLFVGLGVAVLYGTLYPFMAEIITGKKIMLDASFFNTISIPVGLSILGLIGICQRIAWKETSLLTFRNRLGIPLVITAVGTILGFVLGMKNLLALLTCGLGLFVLTTICAELGKAFLPAKSIKTFEKTSLLTKVGRQKPRYAGYVFHLGVVVMLIGIAVSSTYRLEQEVQLQPGKSFMLGDIRFHYERLSVNEDPQKGVVSAEISVYNGERKIASVVSEKQFYGRSPDAQVITEIGLHSSLKEDIYVILEGWQEDHTATFTFIIHPLIIWIWIGGVFVFTIGMIVTMSPYVFSVLTKILRTAGVKNFT